MARPSEADGYTLHKLRSMAHANGLKGYTVMSKAELYRELFGEQQKNEAFSKKETLKAEPVLQPSSTDVVRRRRLRSF